ncbi:MAG: hypothetical protein IJ598_02195 [Ruminococcus sp.]|nr:hypothetical protein [Ruminococcus sp.]
MKKIILFSATGVILIACVITSAVAQQYAFTPPAVAQTQQSQEDKRFVLGAERGRLVVYRQGESEPFITTETFTYTLPKPDRLRLEQGIEINGEAALRRTLEDYCS